MRSSSTARRCIRWRNTRFGEVSGRGPRAAAHPVPVLEVHDAPSYEVIDLVAICLSSSARQSIRWRYVRFQQAGAQGRRWGGQSGSELHRVLPFLPLGSSRWADIVVAVEDNDLAAGCRPRKLESRRN
ncbi:hypothetical protein E2562_028858 [Oryza meyeriana var. granulata]|uniref:Uncharacterized protein n=1 Tax=Oryza meyeriana var. granulata TaxID=110450 RepID=A0A6G1FD83_9ORYZ|nr:hypothetical protein E2562_028858 [Oryza meyeriana var. granulata]